MHLCEKHERFVRNDNSHLCHFERSQFGDVITKGLRRREKSRVEHPDASVTCLAFTILRFLSSRQLWILSGSMSASFEMTNRKEFLPCAGCSSRQISLPFVISNGASLVISLRKD